MRPKEEAMKAGRGKPGHQTFVYLARRVSVAGEDLDPDASVYPYASLDQAKAFCEECTWKDLEDEDIDPDAMLAIEWDDCGPVSTLSMADVDREYGWGIEKAELRGDDKFEYVRPYEVQIEAWDKGNGLALEASRRYQILARNADEAMRRVCEKVGMGLW